MALRDRLRCVSALATTVRAEQLKQSKQQEQGGGAKIDVAFASGVKQEAQEKQSGGAKWKAPLDSDVRNPWLPPAFVALRASPAESTDDRRACMACVNLSQAGRCAAAWRGEFGVRRTFSPVSTLPRRCEGYLPTAGDADRTSGRERWPGFGI